MPSATKFRDLLRLVGINAGIFLLLVVILELMLGNWFVAHVVPDTRLIGRAFRFEQRLYEPHGAVVHTRDQFGLRLAGGPASTADLVTVGGSTTMQQFINDGETWQDVIHKHTGMVVANAGVDGMATQAVDRVLTDWLFQIPEIKAKYFLHYVGINDAGMAQLTGVSERTRRYSWSRRIWGRSAILQAASKLKSMFQGPHFLSHAVVTPDRHPDYKAAHADRTKLEQYVERFYKPNIRYLLELHRSRGQLAIVVSQTANPLLVRLTGSEVLVARPDLGQWAMALSLINAATRSLCKESSSHCHFIDLAGELSLGGDDFYDLTHNTPQGTRKIGEYLADKLKAIIPARSS